MKAGKVIAYIVAGILIFFGVLFIWGATGDQGNMAWIDSDLLRFAQSRPARSNQRHFESRPARKRWHGCD